MKGYQKHSSLKETLNTAAEHVKRRKMTQEIHVIGPMRGAQMDYESLSTEDLHLPHWVISFLRESADILRSLAD